MAWPEHLEKRGTLRGSLLLRIRATLALSQPSPVLEIWFPSLETLPGLHLALIPVLRGSPLRLKSVLVTSVPGKQAYGI